MRSAARIAWLGLVALGGLAVGARLIHRIARAEAQIEDAQREFRRRLNVLDEAVSIGLQVAEREAAEVMPAAELQRKFEAAAVAIATEHDSMVIQTEPGKGGVIRVKPGRC